YLQSVAVNNLRTGRLDNSDVLKRSVGHDLKAGHHRELHLRDIETTRLEQLVQVSDGVSDRCNVDLPELSFRSRLVLGRNLRCLFSSLAIRFFLLLSFLLGLLPCELQLSLMLFCPCADFLDRHRWSSRRRV